MRWALRVALVQVPVFVYRAHVQDIASQVVRREHRILLNKRKAIFGTALAEFADTCTRQLRGVQSWRSVVCSVSSLAGSEADEQAG